MSKTTEIQWTVEGYVECPHCEEGNEFTDEDEFWTVCEVAEQKEFKEPYQMTCKHCKKDFLITKSTY